jgi:ferredoxin--NADP+ reductase
MSTDVRENIPFNLYKPNAPLQATLISQHRLTPEGSPNDIRHIVIQFENSDYRYLTGQSAGIVATGTDALGKNHKLRLYSIASPGYGEAGDPNTLALCVKRVEYNCPETGELKHGICSNYLANLKPGDAVQLSGPAGKEFLMPENPNANLIMVATGTGIAPFRGFIQERYNPQFKRSGQSWLVFGVQHQVDYLYQEELEAFARQHDDFHLITAFSREETTADGEKMYVQQRIKEHRQAILDTLLDKNTYFYICGLRGMETGILEALTMACEERGLVWGEVFDVLKSEKRWHVEVY